LLKRALLTYPQVVVINSPIASVDDKYLQPQVGIVVRINQRTATVDTGNGHAWRVPFHMLRHVLDI
jgi:ABC-type ATPase involved in cell division